MEAGGMAGLGCYAYENHPLYYYSSPPKSAPLKGDQRARPICVCLSYYNC